MRNRDFTWYAIWALASALVASVFAGPAVIIGVVVGLAFLWAYRR
jgi:hypothetical protein